MKYRRQLTFLLTTLLLLITGCNSANPTNEAEAIKTIPLSNDLITVLSPLYGGKEGRFDEKLKQWSWPVLEKKDAGASDFADDVDTRVLMSNSVQHQGKEYCWIVTESIPIARKNLNNSASIGAVILVKNNNNWQVDRVEKFIAQFGHYNGNSSRLVKIGLDSYGAIVRYHRVANGAIEEQMLLLTNYDSKFNALQIDEIAGDNAESCRNALSAQKNCYRYDSQIEFVPGDSPQFYDLKIKSFGTKITKEGQLNNIDQTRTFRFINNNYQSVQ